MATQFKTDKPRVLIVEDEIAVAIHLEDLLTENGYDVVEIATSIEQALDYLDRLIPDAVLLDLDLRGQRATPIAVKLRQKGIPFVLETAQAPAALAGGPFGGAAIVQKPWKECDVLLGLSRLMEDASSCASSQPASVFSFPARSGSALKQAISPTSSHAAILKAERMEEHTLHGEAAEFRLQLGSHLDPRGRTTTPGLSGNRPGIGLKKA